MNDDGAGRRRTAAAAVIGGFPGFPDLVDVVTTAAGVRRYDRYRVANRVILVGCSLIVIAPALLAVFLLAAGSATAFVGPTPT